MACDPRYQEQHRAVLTARGYAILKSELSTQQTAQLHKDLTVTPVAPKEFSAGITSFKVYLESPTRWYVPRFYGESAFGPATFDMRTDGQDLREELTFRGTPRDHQIAAISAFQHSKPVKKNGLICLPCGYGKTFTAIAIATTLIRKKFIIVVHKEFLVDQWRRELMTLVPGIKIGKIQGDKCEIDEEFDCAIAMIQTLCTRPYAIGIFNDFGFAIFDECHHLGAEHFSRCLQKIQCKCMLGLSATPTRADGLRKVFEYYLGKMVYQIKGRAEDDAVCVKVLRYLGVTSTSACSSGEGLAESQEDIDEDDSSYSNTPINYRGDVIRARLINQIAEYKPRTEALVNWIMPILAQNGRKLLILSDRRDHLTDFKEALEKRGETSIGYYVGGMKQKDLSESETKKIILGTFAMASEGMNIPTLNAVLLATPKSSIEQSVGRVLRQRPEERLVNPIILDIIDESHDVCIGQFNKRKAFYKKCSYKVTTLEVGTSALDEIPETPELPILKREEKKEFVFLDD